jgi:N-acetylglucosamine-6-phosphate deacetylase
MILQGKIPATEDLVSIEIEGEKIVGAEPSPRGAPDCGGAGSFLCPGFFDPQVNGFGGVDFNGRSLTADDLHRAALTLASSGVTAFFPTLTTAAAEKTMARLRLLSRAGEKDPLWRRMAIGIHLEGPYLSPEEGFRGAHPAEDIRPPQWEEFRKFQEEAGGQIRLITLAPETAGAIPFIEKAAGAGVVVGLAHTNATEEILEEAFRAGAGLSCHLGNGAHLFLPRHRNPIQKQLAMDGLRASLIADGVRLPDYVVKNFIRAKGAGRVILTTDSMAGAGAPAGRYTIGSVEVEIEEEGGPARFPGTPYLAGSTLTMDRAVSNVIRFAGVPLAAALDMAGKNGGKLFPEAGRDLRSGDPANAVLFEYGERLLIRAVWIFGEKVFEGPSGGR